MEESRSSHGAGMEGQGSTTEYPASTGSIHQHPINYLQPGCHHQLPQLLFQRLCILHALSHQVRSKAEELPNYTLLLQNVW